jgi:hydrogenase maturation protease
LILGLGNSLSDQDNFGPRVINFLKKQSLPPDIKLVDAGTDLLAHIEEFSSCPLVIFVDALLKPEEETPGRILIIAEKELLSWPADSPSIHQFSPLLALQLFRKLYPASNTRFLLVALCVSSVNFSSSSFLPESLIAEGAQTVRQLGTDHGYF